ncbi:MAG: hypothetical protein G01um101470_1002 [Parcubacteria group bacterium Gr01-1014_70]|nr:MAG: hypothetical protein G01um101470_1002 [Parcubacteria group bacterium Gr01-1014_70]
MGLRVPTLGGLKNTQDFLSEHGFPLPLLDTHIYVDGERHVVWWTSGKGVTKSLEEETQKHGPYVTFTDMKRTGPMDQRQTIESGMGCIINYEGDIPFCVFMQEEGQRILDICCPSFMGRVRTVWVF